MLYANWYTGTMMNNIRLLLVVLSLFVSLIAPKTTQAFDIKEVFSGENSIIVKIRERVEYLFTFGVENKVELLERQAERKLETAQSNVKNGDDSKVPGLLQNYLQIKNRQDDILDDVDGEVIDKVEENTLGQQITMEGMKGKIDEGTKQEMIQVQEQVVNQVAQRIVEVNGKEGQTEFFEKVEQVWAPGTESSGPPAGMTYEGGARIIFAPGTSAGGGAGVTYEGGAGQQYAPGSSAGGNSGSDIRGVEVVGN